jgi:hypothetical protein
MIRKSEVKSFLASPEGKQMMKEPFFQAFHPIIVAGLTHAVILPIQICPVFVCIYDRKWYNWLIAD